MSTTQILSDVSTQGVVATSTAAVSAASATFNVVCAWPISSNYGTGSRILFYVLVAACVTFRKAEWLRNTCLAAVLVLPAISALQGMVLASAHINGAIDLDIFGAFQFCAIGILAAPLTVRVSRTYFYTPGRNIIFLWTILILMGLLALCVEFYRVTPTDCSITVDSKLHAGSADFLKQHPNCNITCSETEGPKSSLRGGSASDVYVIPVPRILTFNAGMLLAAGFCIPAILSLIFTWDKVLEANWKRRRHVEKLDAQIEGANMTVGEMKSVNELVRQFLTVIEIPLFGGVILTIIGVGEANFFSPQMLHMTEPMASLGQWSPIAGTILAAFGSLYILWSASDEDDSPEKHTIQRKHLNSLFHSQSSNQWQPPRSARSPDRSPRNSDLDEVTQGNTLRIRSESPNEIASIPPINHTSSESNHSYEISQDIYQNDHQPTAGRHKVRKWLTAAGNYLGDAAHEKLDPEHKRNDNEVRAFPEVPGENLRNPDLENTSRNYERLREARASSTCSPSLRSISDVGGSSSLPPVNEASRPETSPDRQRKRRATLEVPKEVHGRSENH